MSHAVAIIGELAGDVLVTSAGGGAKAQRILAEQRIRNRRGSGRVEVLLVGRTCSAQGGMQRVQDFSLAPVQSLVTCPLLGEVDDHVVGVRVGDVADLLNDGLAEPLLRQA